MEQVPNNMSTKAGTAGGTLLVVLVQIAPEEIVKTIVLAGLGAVVSFAVSVGMKWLWRKLRTK